MRKKGLVQVYTGEGKGKTTASLGLALRASGRGFKVYIAQFLKSANYGEEKVLGSLRNIKMEQFGRGCLIKRKAVKKKDKELARKGLEKVKEVIDKGNYDLVILDEVNVAIKLGLLGKNDIVRLIKAKPSWVELVLTGRYAPDWILEISDLVTEMKEIKHYYKKGIKAREGIEY